jgi:hypothetical protein
MIDTGELKKSTCVIDAAGTHGTGIFVSADLILTSLHVVDGDLTGTITGTNYEKKEFEAFVKAVCQESDLAILKTKSYQATDIVKLCNEIPVIGTLWATHGHPGTAEGQAVGEKLHGQIKDLITIDHEHDIVLDAGAITITTEYRGFSGSGIINEKRQVTSVMRYRDTNAMCSVSIRKAEKFLRENGVYIFEDELDSFSNYQGHAFQALAGSLKDICVSHADQVAIHSSPQAIAEGLTGNMFYPKKEPSLTGIIGYLKKNITLNSSLWVGWLEYLSYIQMLRGSYSDINAIYITLKDTEISKLVEGTETVVKQDLTITLQFFFTSEKEYFTIARRYLSGQHVAGTLQPFHCHIFNSDVPRFGQQTITSEDKKNIISDIASPGDAGMQIAGDINFGVLSFDELSRKVAGSRTLTDATNNLKQIFINAIS